MSRLCGYSSSHKNEFRRLSRRLLKEVADLTALGSADLRSNEGGIAVCGEATLHADTMYVQMFGIDLGILHRTYKHCKDYSGGYDNWFSWSCLQQFGAQGLAAREWARKC